MVARAPAGIPRASRAAELATIVRVESGPRDQLHLDLGQEQGRVAGEWGNYPV